MADVLYADPYLHELGYLRFAEGDFSIGKENTFSLKVPTNIGLDDGHYLMIEGTQYGGIIEDPDIDTTKDYYVAAGRTWHGLLETTMIVADSGKTHLVVNGDANDVLGMLIKRQGLDYCMAGSNEASGIMISNYQFERWVYGYTGIRAMLKSVGAKLMFSYSSELRRAIAYAVPREEYIDDGIDGDKVNFKISRRRVVNHIMGLGKGEGLNRIVVNRYADDNGNISSKQTLFGSKYKGERYDSPNSELADLTEGVEKRLREAQAKKYTCSLIEINAEKYDIDDIVGGTSTKHNVSVVTTIAQKICTINSRGKMKFQTKTALEV